MKRILLAALTATLPVVAHAGSYSFSVAAPDLAHGTAYTWGLYGTTYGGNYDTLRQKLTTGGEVITSAKLVVTNIYDWANETTDPADALYINILGGLDTGMKTGVFDANASAPSSSFSLAKNPFVAGNSFNTTLDATSLNFQNAQTNSLLKYTGSVMPNGTVINYTKTGTPADVTWSDPSGGSTGDTIDLDDLGTGTNTLFGQYGSVFDLVLDFTAGNIALLQTLLKADANTGSPTVGLGFGPECHYYVGDFQLTIVTSAAPPPPSVPDGGNTLVLMGLALIGALGFRRFSAQRA